MQCLWVNKSLNTLTNLAERIIKCDASVFGTSEQSKQGL